jgi:serine protease AprX
MKFKATKSATWGRTVLTLFGFLLSASLVLASVANHRKMSKDLEGKKASDQVNVIVQFNHMPTAKQHSKVLSRGGALHRELRSIRAGSYTVPASKLAELVADPEVSYVSPDRPLKGASTGSTTQVLDYHTDSINAPAAWALGLDGTGIGVAVIDSGVANVSDLTASNVVYSQDFVGDNSGSAVDLFGHGTHVAGIVAGNGSNSTGANFTYTFQGVAKNANVINLRVLDANGGGTDSEVISAIETAIQLQNTYNIRVINLSLGRGVYESYTQDPLCQAVEQAWQAGIVVVVAAGNDGRDNSGGTLGYGTITAPGNDPYVITVGAMNSKGTADRTDDVPASYSSKGPTLGDLVVKPDLVAPGNAIVSLYTPTETLNQENPAGEVALSLYQADGAAGSSGSYYELSGTSMATPMVSGAAALLLQQNPNLTPDQVKALLMVSAFRNLIPYSTATNVGTGQVYNEQADMFTVGAGYLDIAAAIAETGVPPAALGSAMSPFATSDANGNIVFAANRSVAGSNIAWGTIDASENIAWGTIDGSNIAWGTIDGANIAWGTIDGSNIAWGTLDGSNIAWGTIDGASSVAQSSLDAGENIAWGTIDGSNIAWGTLDGSNIAWGTLDGSNIAWGTIDGANIAWGTIDGSSVGKGAADKVF